MAAIAVANGALRELTFGKLLSERGAHQLSTATGAVALGFYIRAVVRAWPPRSPRNALAVGLLWLALTVLFEFAFGLVVLHRSWDALLGDYDLAAGRVWALLLAWVALAPLFFRPPGGASP